MDRSARLHLVARITYYVGWFALLAGGVVHYVARGLLVAVGLTQRNLMEISVVCFIICMASEVRGLTSTAEQLPSVAKRQAAA
jgi:hypothetical protein